MADIMRKAMGHLGPGHCPYYSDDSDMFHVLLWDYCFQSPADLEYLSVLGTQDHKEMFRSVKGEDGTRPQDR